MSLFPRWSVPAAACIALGCTDGAPAPAAGDAGGAADTPATVPDAPGGDTFVNTTGQTLAHRMGPWTVPAGGERSADCESWTLDNEEPLYVNTVDFTTSTGMHHSNWFFVPEASYQGPDGTWACRSRNFDQGAASLVGGVFFAQSTQVTAEAQRFPAGTAIVVPPRSRIIGQLHMLNASPQPRQITMAFTVRTLARSEVRTRLSPFYIEYGPLEIAPRGRTELSVECDLDERSRMLTGAPLAMRFFYGLAHYHELGSRMAVTVLGGAMNGRTLYETEVRQGDSWARTMEPAIDVGGARGLRLTCVFDNPRSATVRYGIGDQEMCIWFGFTDSAYQWAGRATSAGRAMIRTEVRDGVTHRTAPCSELFTSRTRNIND